MDIGHMKRNTSEGPTIFHVDIFHKWAKVDMGKKFDFCTKPTWVNLFGELRSESEELA